MTQKDCMKIVQLRKTKNVLTQNKEATQMAKDVVCSVDNCTYWQHGNKCNAGTIEVNNHLASEKAYKSDETLCKTFKPQASM